MHLPNPTPNTKRCGQCDQFDRSKGCKRYGYCKSGRDYIARSRLLDRDTVCLFTTEWSASHA